MNEREIFLSARESTDMNARTAFLASACAGNEALRRRVECLLRADEVPDSLLDVPAVAPYAADPTICRAADPLADTTRDQAPPVEILHLLAPSDRPDSLGRIGHYEVLEVLGSGGFGIVFRALDEKLQRVVAVKVLVPQLAATLAARQRFLREARSSAAIRHENVVQVYAVEEQPLPFLVMEYIPGETLQQRLDRCGPLEVSDVLRIGRQIAEGLAAAHGTGLIHRDVKPANVLVERGTNQRVKLTDFGLARAADDASLSQSGIVAGTPMYMSPEQARGEAIDVRSDLFSLGSVLYAMVSGRPPFRAENTYGVLKRVIDDSPRPIQDLNPGAPDWLCDTISKLHAKDAGERFQSAQEVADVLVEMKDEVGRMKGERKTSHRVRPANSSFILQPSSFPLRPWSVAVAALILLVTGLGVTEATGITQLRGTVVRLLTAEGTLVVETDDPGVSLSIDGAEVTISGAGVKEIRVKAGPHKVAASKDGKIVREELVTVTRNGKQVVRVSRESLPAVGRKGERPEIPTAAKNFALRFETAGEGLAIPSLKLPVSGPLTMEGYVTLPEVPGGNQIYLLGVPYLFNLELAFNHFLLFGKDKIEPMYAHATAAEIPTAGKRYHLAGVRTEEEFQLYVDGKLAAACRATEGRSWNFIIGKKIAADFDEIRVSKTIRYTPSFTPLPRFEPDADTLALYHFDEGEGTSARDSSGNGHHLEIGVGKWTLVTDPSTQTP